MAVTKNLKQGEGKTLVFTVTDAAGDPVDITAATLTYTVKQAKSDTTALFQKEDADFDKTQATSGICKVPVSETDTNLDPGIYYSELKVFYTTTMVEKSQDILLNIEEAVN